jgi:hypothetical protein
MTSYTHNIKIILVDTNENIVTDNDFLDEIKNVLCQYNTKNVRWNMQNIKITLQWEKKELNNIEKHLMGDLFLNSIYDYDSIIVNHATQTISSVNNKSNYSVKFYITRCIGDKKVCSDSYGIV